MKTEYHKHFNYKERDIVIKPQVPKFLNYLKEKRIGIVIGVFVLLTGLYLMKLIVIISGLFIVERLYASAKYQMDRELEKTNWYLLNEGRIIIYYAAKSHIQRAFKELLNELKIYESEIYYNGSKLESTISIPKSIKTAISRTEYEFQGPAVLKLENYRVKRAIELHEIKNLRANRSRIVDKLNRIKKL